MSEASQNESYAIPGIGTFALEEQTRSVGMGYSASHFLITLNGVGLGLTSIDKAEGRRLIHRYVSRLLIERQGKLSDELWEVGQTLGELSSDSWNLGTFRVRRQP